MGEELDYAKLHGAPSGGGFNWGSLFSNLGGEAAGWATGLGGVGMLATSLFDLMSPKPQLDPYVPLEHGPTVSKIADEAMKTKFYQRGNEYADINSEFYDKTNQMFRTQMAGTTPSMATLMNIGARGGTGRAFNQAKANANFRDYNAQLGANVGSNLLKTHLGFQQQADQMYSGAYNVAGEWAKMKQSDLQQDHLGRNTYNVNKNINEWNNRNSTYNSLYGMFGGMLGAGLKGKGKNG